MTLLLSGTNGVSDVDGTAATPAIRGSDTNTGIFFPAADTIAFAGGGVEAARFDSGRRLGIGNTDPAYRIDVTAGDTTAGFGYAARLRSNATAGAATLQFTNNAVSTENGFIRVTDAGLMSFTNRAYIDSSGNLLVGTTSAVSSDTTQGIYLLGSAGVGQFVRTSNASLDVGRLSTTGNCAVWRYAGTVVGSISVTGSATAYNTSSDYRLKENIAPMTGALSRVAALKPCTYVWKATGESDEGFIAHELAEVVPQCVTGEKDAVDADGNPQYQGIDTSFLVATLTAAIQELKGIVDAQGAEIAALKAKA